MPYYFEFIPVAQEVMVVYRFFLNIFNSRSDGHFCAAMQNNLCNFGRGQCVEHL